MLAKLLAKAKAWAWPLARTFGASFGATLVAGLAHVDFAHFHTTDLPVLGGLVIGALGVAVNVVILAVQKATPGVPDPKPPAA